MVILFLFGGCGYVEEKLTRWVYVFPRIHLSPGFSFDFVFVIFLFFCFISMFEVGLGGGMDEYWMVRMVF